MEKGDVIRHLYLLYPPVYGVIRMVTSGYVLVQWGGSNNIDKYSLAIAMMYLEVMMKHDKFRSDGEKSDYINVLRAIR